MQPLISIIVPTYNAEHYLTITLTSIFNQTYTNFEVIVVNDGSIDNTETILKTIQHQEPRLKIINQTNQGISNARNVGIVHAKGEFIAFIDSDDRWHPTFLAKMVQRQQQTAGEIIYTGNIDCSIDAEKPRISDFREQDNLCGYLTQKSLLHIGCLFVRKALLEKNKITFNSALKTGEDIVFICHLFCLTNAYSVPEYLYYYTHRDNSIMHKPWTSQDYLNDLMAWQELEQIIKQYYQQKNRTYIISLIESKIVYYKLRLLWLLLVVGRHQELIDLLNSGFLTYDVHHLPYLPKKYAGIRRKIILSKNKLLWKLVSIIHAKHKINLV
ncbi:MAG: glycosyltransferase [Candidatus Schmidhempelia sp.]|nr:glycosyltransferase [Candidatus Schmidhempelia sp.]